MSFLPQVLRFPAHFWAGGSRPPNHRHAAAIGPPQTGPAAGAGHEALARIELSPVGWARVLGPGVLHVLGVRPLRILAEEGRLGRSRRVAGERGLDRHGQADRGRGPRRRRAGRHRGADPGGHAGDRDFQPALCRERRALHDRQPDVRGRYRIAADLAGDLHPVRPSPGDGALRPAETVHAGGEQAGARRRRRHQRRDRAAGIARRGDRPLRRHSGARRRRRRYGQPRHLRARRCVRAPATPSAIPIS